MRNTALFFLMAVLITAAGAVAGFAAWGGDGNETTDNGDWLTNFTFDFGYDIGVGWMPAPKPFIAKAMAKVNLRSVPTLRGEIVATVDKGTELELSGISAANSVVMSDEERDDHLIEYFRPSDDYERGMLTNWPKYNGWYRAKYSDGFAWVHEAFIDTSESGSLYYDHFFKDHTLYLPDLYAVALNFDANGELTTVEYLRGVTGEELIVPFLSLGERYGKDSYLEKPYYESGRAEPVYDIRWCAPDSFLLYRARETGAETPLWFRSLPEDIIVADYVTSGGRIFVADMASGRVLTVDSDGSTVAECSSFALPLRLSEDGNGGVWAADPFTYTLVHLDEECRPVGTLEGIAAKDLAYNGVSRTVRMIGRDEYYGQLCSYYLYEFDDSGNIVRKEDDFSGIKTIYESGNVSEDDSFHLNPPKLSSIEVKGDGSTAIYLWTEVAP
ncbi:MAG: hypothetical protein JSW52_10010 [Candidatus Coatesbacteria bacterium]|nr:MAG: hypothetical protein JSW52_10010 [Candidatus Coatesbacteria bacterium]